MVAVWEQRESLDLKDEESGMWTRKNILGRRSSMYEGPEVDTFLETARCSERLTLSDAEADEVGGPLCPGK